MPRRESLWINDNERLTITGRIGLSQFQARRKKELRGTEEMANEIGNLEQIPFVAAPVGNFTRSRATRPAGHVNRYCHRHARHYLLAVLYRMSDLTQ